MGLTRDTVLQLAPELDIQLSTGELHVHTPHAALCYPLDKLEVLAAFTSPCTLADALDALQRTSPTQADWMDLSAMVVDWVNAGVLIIPGETTPALAHGPGSYAAAKIHIEMLNDVARTEAYVGAIRANVRKGDIVVDLGTGSGVLAVAAAQAGAARVYAIERSGIADAAEAVFQRAGFGDRITLLRGHSTTIDVPEKADVLLSELVGHEPLAERLIEVTRDAVTRFLKSDGTKLPRRLRIFARAVQLPEDVVNEHLFTERSVAGWKQRYGVDLSGLLDAQPSSAYRLTERTTRAASWQLLSERVELASLDLLSPPPRLERTVEATVTHGGRLDGALIFFELDVDDQHTISTDPLVATADNHWRVAVRLRPNPEQVERGGRLSFRYRHSAARTTLEVVRA